MSSTAVGAVLGTVVGGLVIGALLRCPTREMMANSNFFSNENVKILVTDADGNLIVKSTEELKQYIDAKAQSNTNLITDVNDRIKKIDGDDGSINGINVRTMAMDNRLRTVERAMPNIEASSGATDALWRNDNKVPLPYRIGYSGNLGKYHDITMNDIKSKLPGKDKFTYQDIVTACIKYAEGQDKSKYVGVRKYDLLNNTYDRNYPNPCWYQKGQDGKKAPSFADLTTWEQARFQDNTTVTYNIR